jgi:hypothetical protein
MVATNHLLAIAILAGSALSGPASAQGAATAGQAGAGQRLIGSVTRQEAGDTACYLTLRSDAGAETTAMADFALCQGDPGLTGKRVELVLTPKAVMDESCGGNPACRKTRQVMVATSVSILGGSPAQAGTAHGAEPSSHCTTPERVVFACPVGTKLVSVCADPAAGPKTGYLQYRFGKPGPAEALEINWPDNRLPPQAAATGGSEAFSGGGAAWLRVHKGSYAYVVYTGIGRWGTNGRTLTREGVVVEHRGKVIASLKCSRSATSELGPAWFDKVGMQSRDESFDLPD